jgi:hypothetical protein
LEKVDLAPLKGDAEPILRPLSAAGKTNENPVGWESRRGFLDSRMGRDWSGAIFAQVGERGKPLGLCVPH